VNRIENLLATIMDFWSTHPTSQQQVLAANLSSRLNELSRLQVAGDASDFWRSRCEKLAAMAATEDPRFFMRWQPIQETMVHGMNARMLGDWRQLRRATDWRHLWKPALRHRQHGHPPPFPPMISTNAMAVEHATHLYRFRESMDVPFQDAGCVIEFGGGFGSMCRLVHALGFTGTYIIFDLPHVLALQRYYLGLHGIRADLDGQGGVRLCCEIGQVRRLLANLAPRRVSAMSTWAMSEMPLNLRTQIEAVMTDQCDKLLIAWQPSFEGIDNHAWFREFAERSKGRIAWKQRAVLVDPAQATPADSQYLFGMRRS
jgi:hypothetical protein